jgi:hypothetical protein
MLVDINFTDLRVGDMAFIEMPMDPDTNWRETKWKLSTVSHICLSDLTAEISEDHRSLGPNKEGKIRIYKPTNDFYDIIRMTDEEYYNNLKERADDRR